MFLSILLVPYTMCHLDEESSDTEVHTPVENRTAVKIISLHSNPRNIITNVNDHVRLENETLDMTEGKHAIKLIPSSYKYFKLQFSNRQFLCSNNGKRKVFLCDQGTNWKIKFQGDIVQIRNKKEKCLGVGPFDHNLKGYYLEEWPCNKIEGFIWQMHDVRDPDVKLPVNHKVEIGSVNFNVSRVNPFDREDSIDF